MSFPTVNTSSSIEAQRMNYLKGNSNPFKVKIFKQRKQIQEISLTVVPDSTEKQSFGYFRHRNSGWIFNMFTLTKLFWRAYIEFRRGDYRTFNFTIYQK